jgi:hypothetical protein
MENGHPSRYQPTTLILQLVNAMYCGDPRQGLFILPSASAIVVNLTNTKPRYFVHSFEAPKIQRCQMRGIDWLLGSITRSECSTMGSQPI